MFEHTLIVPHLTLMLAIRRFVPSGGLREKMLRICGCFSEGAVVEVSLHGRSEWDAVSRFYRVCFAEIGHLGNCWTSPGVVNP